MNTRKLAHEIEYELEQLDGVMHAASCLMRVPPEQRDPWDAAAAAKYVADISLGFENLCKSRCRHLQLDWPSGSDSHRQILQQFLNDADLGGRLPPGMPRLLEKYQRFRHRFVHGYGFQVSWEIVEEPLRLIPEMVAALKAVWGQWLAGIPDDPQ
ncbi:MAG: hypothetical protein NTX50_16220 [Candidatus Sumerlaeota bacterium]|nr:hypothetical protein [Candidatus Sumerlaeota bacterium]